MKHTFYNTYYHKVFMLNNSCKRTGLINKMCDRSNDICSNYYQDRNQTLFGNDSTLPTFLTMNTNLEKSNVFTSSYCNEVHIWIAYCRVCVSKSFKYSVQRCYILKPFHFHILRFDTVNILEKVSSKRIEFLLTPTYRIEALLNIFMLST